MVAVPANANQERTPDTAVPTSQVAGLDSLVELQNLAHLSHAPTWFVTALYAFNQGVAIAVAKTPDHRRGGRYPPCRAVPSHAAKARWESLQSFPALFSRGTLFTRG